MGRATSRVPPASACASLAERADRRQHLLRVGPVDEWRIDAQLDRQPRQPLEFVVRPEHQHVDTGHHARDHLIGDLRERLLAELKEH